MSRHWNCLTAPGYVNWNGAIGNSKWSWLS